jgi:predicted aspartyl protease
VATRTSHFNKKAKQRIYPENILVTVLTVVATIFQVTNKFAQRMRKPEFRAQNREKSNEIDNSIKAIITTPRETGSSANDDSDEYSFTLTQGQSKFSQTKVTKTNKGVFVTAKINETDIRLVLDSGATTNILDSASYERIQKNNAKLQLEPINQNIPIQLYCSSTHYRQV